jgi:protease IV
MNKLSSNKMKWKIFLPGLCAALLTSCAYVNVSLKDERKPLQEMTISGKGSNKILITEVQGFISAEEVRSSLLDSTWSPSLVSQIKEELQKAEEDSHIKAVVVRINSPGGMVTASDIIYQELRSFREKTGRPVIASMMDLGTSGAYYIAQAADRILAHPTTVTGSIGVIMVRPDIEGLLKKLGIRTTEIKSGELKAMGSPFKPISPEEQKVFQGVIDEMYERFLEVVMDGRPSLTPKETQALADGRIYTARQALEAGLIDEIGYLSDAVERAKQLTGLEHARVVRYHRPGDFKGSLYAGVPTLHPGVLLDALESLNTPRFLYLWMP